MCSTVAFATLLTLTAMLQMYFHPLRCYEQCSASASQVTTSWRHINQFIIIIIIIIIINGRFALTPTIRVNSLRRSLSEMRIA